MMITRHLIVSGRVQGVGYRDALRDEAEKRNVSGWVRNRRDGSVEALVQGAPEAVDAVVAWARRGPGMARVTDLRVNLPPADLDRPYTRFERWPTA
jgi:acylphosphatase